MFCYSHHWFFFLHTFLTHIHEDFPTCSLVCQKTVSKIGEKAVVPQKKKRKKKKSFAFGLKMMRGITLYGVSKNHNLQSSDGKITQRRPRWSIPIKQKHSKIIGSWLSFSISFLCSPSRKMCSGEAKSRRSFPARSWFFV